MLLRLQCHFARKRLGKLRLNCRFLHRLLLSSSADGLALEEQLASMAQKALNNTNCPAKVLVLSQSSSEGPADKDEGQPQSPSNCVSMGPTASPLFHAISLQPCTWVCMGTNGVEESHAAVLVEHLPMPACSDAMGTTSTNVLKRSSSSRVEDPSRTGHTEAGAVAKFSSPLHVREQAMQKLSARLARHLSIMDSAPVILSLCTIHGLVLYQVGLCDCVMYAMVYVMVL